MLSPYATTPIACSKPLSRETMTKPPPHREAKGGDVGNAIAVYDDANGEHRRCRAMTHDDETAIAPIRGDNETAAASRGEDGGVDDVTNVCDNTNGMLHRRRDTEVASTASARRNSCVGGQSLPRKVGGSHCLGVWGAPHDGEVVPVGEESTLSGTLPAIEGEGRRYGGEATPEGMRVDSVSPRVRGQRQKRR